MEEQIAKLISDLTRKKFWGKVEIEFRDGQVTILRKSETIKLHGEQPYGNDRRY
jgi:hypothetical protein